MKTTKTTKPAKADKKQKKFKETREDIRQKARVEALVKEARSVLAKLDAMHKIMDSDKFKKMPDIDRHIMAVAFSALESYAAALSLKADWENVRIKTSTGEPIHGCACKFVEFVFGWDTANKFRKLACNDAKKA